MTRRSSATVSSRPATPGTCRRASTSAGRWRRWAGPRRRWPPSAPRWRTCPRTPIRAGWPISIPTWATRWSSFGRYDEAFAAYRAIAAVRPQAAAWNESLLLLLLGRYPEGWRQYESRWGVADHDPPRADARVPDLAEVAGKRVLLIARAGAWRHDPVRPLRAAARRARGARHGADLSRVAGAAAHPGPGRRAWSRWASRNPRPTS